MKKIIAVLLVAVIALSLALISAGCNKQLVDLTYSYEYAIIGLPNGSVLLRSLRVIHSLEKLSLDMMPEKLPFLIILLE